MADARPSPRVRWAAAAVGAAVLLVTLPPGRNPPSMESCILCGEGWVADAVANVLLFVPVGLALAFLRVRRPPAWLLAALASTAIEAAQTWLIPGRDGSPGDIVANTVGGAAGAFLVTHAAAWLWPARRSLAAAAAGAAALGIIAGTGVLARPSLPASVWWGQWTPRFADLGSYEGRVTAAALEGIPLPDFRLSRSAEVRAALLGGGVLEVGFTAGRAPERFAPVFSVADDRQRFILLAGARGTAGELRVRRLAADAHLRQPHIRLPGAFAGVRPGAPAALAVRRAGASWCLGVNGAEWCRVGVSPGGGWRLLVSSYRVSVAVAALLDAVWLGLLFLPVAFWARGRGGVALVAAVLVADTALAPRLAGLDPASLAEWAAAGAGIAAGLALRRIADRRHIGARAGS